MERVCEPNFGVNQHVHPVLTNRSENDPFSNDLISKNAYKLNKLHISDKLTTISTPLTYIGSSDGYLHTRL
jgi:hypothetical protein